MCDQGPSLYYFKSILIKGRAVTDDLAGGVAANKVCQDEYESPPLRREVSVPVCTVLQSSKTCGAFTNTQDLQLCSTIYGRTIYGMYTYLATKYQTYICLARYARSSISPHCYGVSWYCTCTVCQNLPVHGFSR